MRSVMNYEHWWFVFLRWSGKCLRNLFLAILILSIISGVFLISCKFIDHAFPLKVKSTKRELRINGATQQDSYKDAYDLFSSHFNILLTVITIFGLAIPALVYLLQRQSLKDERERIIAEAKKDTDELRKQIDGRIEQFDLRINEGLSISFGQRNWDNANLNKATRPLQDIWHDYILALDAFSYSTGIYDLFRLAYEDLTKTLDSRHEEKYIPTDSVSVENTIPALKNILSKEHIKDPGIRSRFRNWLNELTPNE